jgi:hypothetical protein
MLFINFHRSIVKLLLSHACLCPPFGSRSHTCNHYGRIWINSGSLVSDAAARTVESMRVKMSASGLLLIYDTYPVRVRKIPIVITDFYNTSRLECRRRYRCARI